MSTNRRKFLAAGAAGAAAAAVPAQAQSKPTKKVIYRDGKKPEKTPGLDFFDTGAVLVTDKPVDGVPSISVEEGLKKCWG